MAVSVRVRSIRSIRISRIVDALKRAALVQQGNCRSGWHQQKCEYGKKRIGRIERRRRNPKKMMLELARTPSLCVGLDSFHWLDS
jgi:hypothetical protein